MRALAVASLLLVACYSASSRARESLRQMERVQLEAMSQFERFDTEYKRSLVQRYVAMRHPEQGEAKLTEYVKARARVVAIFIEMKEMLVSGMALVQLMDRGRGNDEFTQWLTNLVKACEQSRGEVRSFMQWATQL